MNKLLGAKKGEVSLDIEYLVYDTIPNNINNKFYNNKFYSWLGGVDPDYRKHGIALTLMEKQHEYLRKNGYKVVQTKTMNKWRNMLILNIKNGFNIIETYTDDNGLQKIVLEKTLLN